MAPVLAFDIETVPDVAGIRRLHNLPEDLADAEVAEVAFQKRRTQTGSDFLAPHLHRVLVISCVLREGDTLKVFSLGDATVAGVGNLCATRTSCRKCRRKSALSNSPCT